MKPLTDEDPMPFGKWAGTKMKNVPADYLDWLHGQEWLAKWMAVKLYIEAKRKAIDWELKRQGKL